MDFLVKRVIVVNNNVIRKRFCWSLFHKYFPTFIPSNQLGFGRAELWWQRDNNLSDKKEIAEPEVSEV